MTKRLTHPDTPQRRDRGTAAGQDTVRKTQDMKDSYANQSPATQPPQGQTEGDWVVIRRRKAPKPADTKDAGQARALDKRAAEVARALDVARGIPADKMGIEDEQAPEADAEPKVTEDAHPYVLEDPQIPETETAAPQEVVKPRVQPKPATPQPANMWTSLPRVPMGAHVNGKRARRSAPSLIEYFRADPIAKGFDLLRTRLMRTIRAYGWRRIAVVSPTQGCGTTFTVVNLALSLSRVPGSRTVLMDLNQRTPGVAEALGLRSTARVDRFLNAEMGLEDYLVRPAPTLAVGTTNQPCSFAAEVLHDPLTAEVLDDMIETLDPDLVLYDMPPILEYDDMAAFLSQVDGVLLVADGTKTVPSHISGCERLLEGQSQLLGVVLNRGRVGGIGELTV